MSLFPQRDLTGNLVFCPFWEQKRGSWEDGAHCITAPAGEGDSKVERMAAATRGKGKQELSGTWEEDPGPVLWALRPWQAAELGLAETWSQWLNSKTHTGPRASCSPDSRITCFCYCSSASVLFLSLTI